MCNRVVDFLLARDRKAVLRFAPLQGETAARLLNVEEVKSLKSIVFRDGGIAWRKSSSVVRILWYLGGHWRVLAALLWIIPRPIRDVGYSFVASIRYRLFGRRETCRLPTPEQRQRFLP